MDDRRRVGVTGATGFAGGVLARELARRGFEVVCLAREGSRLPEVPQIVPVIGEFDEPGVLERFTQGLDCVFHVAAMYREHGNRAQFERVNVEFTRQLLAAAATAGVRRFVYTSTIGVHASVPQVPADEDAPLDPQDDYQTSKLAAERVCAGFIGASAMEVCIVRPCAIYGPGDTRMLKMFRMLRSRTFFFVGNFHAHFHAVYIDDLVAGLLLCMDRPEAAGRTYIMGGPTYQLLEDYVGTAADALAVRRPWLRVPYRPLYLLAALIEAAGAVVRIQPPLHRRRVKFFKHDRGFSIARARRELGYDPKIDLAEGFRRTVAWYRQEGLLPPN